MKRKALIAFALVVVMCTGNKIAYAAPSPTAEDTTILANAVEVSSESGTAEAIALDMLTEANNLARQLVADIISKAQESSEGSEDAEGNLLLSSEGTPLGASAEPELVAAFDFTPSESVKQQIEKKGAAEVTFECGDVKEGDCIKVLHYVDNDWEVIEPTAVKDGKVTAKFTSFSPIVITKFTPEVAVLEKEVKKINVYAIVGISLIAIAAIVVVFALGNRKSAVKTTAGVKNNGRIKKNGTR